MKSKLSNGTWTRLGQICCVAVLTAIGGLVSQADDASSDSTKSDQLQAPTHRQVRIIEPKVDGQSSTLYTIATTPDGHLLAGLSAGTGTVLMMNAEGETLQQWSLELTPSGIAVAPDGTIYVGGSGRIAQLGADGTIVKVINSPHVGNVDDMKKEAAEAIRRSRVQMSASLDRQIKLLKDRVATIEEKEEADLTKLEEAQLKAYTTQLKTLEEMIGADGTVNIPDTHLNAAMNRTMNITSMAASNKDLFICAADPGQGGYSIWRVGRDLDTESCEVIMDGLRGCCGQMDIQCCKDQLVISENTKFKIGVYDRHGRAQQSFGSRDRTSRKGFGSCCNPMNSLPLDDGTILTAESSIGHIKRFDVEGNLIAYVGKAAIGGGCKHCALGYDAKNDLYYMMYQDKNAICVLANNKNTPMTIAERELEQRQIDFLARAAGEWNIEGAKKSTATSGGFLSLFGGGRGGSSQHPVSSLRLGNDGSAKILAGMYQAYGDDASLELLPQVAGSDSISFALAIDQVRFLEGTWEFVNDDTAKVAFQGLAKLTFQRDASAEKCAGKDCQDPSCKDENCPQHKPAEPAVGSTADVVIEAQSLGLADLLNSGDAVELDAVEMDDMDMSGAMGMQTMLAGPIVTPKFQYKLLSRKGLGDDAEGTLNRLGAEGWDFCGRVGKQLMFKRAVFMTDGNAFTAEVSR